MDQQDPNATEWLKQPNGHKSQSSSAYMLDHADLLDYMYQHVQFDEIPFSQDPLYDHRQIYTHENAFMPFGIYEDVQAAVAFEMEIENEKEISYIESSNTAYIHNVGRTACPNHHTCVTAACNISPVSFRCPAGDSQIRVRRGGYGSPDGDRLPFSLWGGLRLAPPRGSGSFT